VNGRSLDIQKQHRLAGVQPIASSVRKMQSLLMDSSASSCTAKINVLLADDHTIVRDGLRMLLESTPNIKVVAEAENGRQAVQLADQLKPDVVIMDLLMPNLNGVEATRQILRKAPKAKGLVLSTYTDDAQVAALVETGVVGYVVKQAASNDLVKAIHEVRRGNAFFSPSISKGSLRRAREAYAKGQTVVKGISLTARETEVLRLVAEGYANKQIADSLGISIKTVEKHRQKLMDKTDIHETAGLTRYAIARGIVPGKAPALANPEAVAEV